MKDIDRVRVTNVSNLDDCTYRDQLDKCKKDLEILVTALKAIIKRDYEWGSSIPLSDCKQCAINALIIVGKYNED